MSTDTASASRLDEPTRILLANLFYPRYMDATNDNESPFTPTHQSLILAMHILNLTGLVDPRAGEAIRSMEGDPVLNFFSYHFGDIWGERT